MITYDMIADAMHTLKVSWGETGKELAVKCLNEPKLGYNLKEFLNYYCPCEGIGPELLLNGIQALYPDIWEEIPKDMGCFAFSALYSMLILLGIDTSE